MTNKRNNTDIGDEDFKKAIAQLALACAMQNQLLVQLLDGSAPKDIVERSGSNFMKIFHDTTEHMLELCDKMVPGDE